MHPFIRIALFLVIAISLAQLNIKEIITAAILLVLLFFIYPSAKMLTRSFKLIRRLRWLFFSIFIIYAWFTPGTLLLPEWGVLSPYSEGVIHGLLRIVALVILLISLGLLVFPLSQDELIGAIYWYSHPLSLLGLSRERLVARLVLTIKSVKKLESEWNKTAGEQQDNLSLQNRYQRVLQLFHNVMDKAEEDKLTVLNVAVNDAPVWYQWFIPFIIACIFWLI